LIKGTVVTGFNRGSTQLGFPTANIYPDQKNLLDTLVPGIYAGTIKLE
jgi:FAD synthase